MLRPAGVFKLILNTALFVFLTSTFKVGEARANFTNVIASEVETQMRQAAEEGSEQSYLTCAKILESAPAMNRFALVVAMDAGIEARREKSGERKELALPEPLKKQLIEMWAVDSFHPALIRVLARSGSPSAYSRAGFLANEQAHSISMRMDMINLMGESRRADVLQSLLRVIGPSSILKIREAGLEALRNFESEDAARGILKVYHLMNEGVRYRAQDVLFERKGWSRLFLEELEAKRIFTGDVPTEQLQKIARFEDQQLNAYITNRWGLIRGVPEKKQMEVKRFKKMLAEKRGNPGNGGKLFEANCAQCHAFSSDGQKVGPNLNEVSRHNTDFLLTSLVDPDAFIRKKFLVYELEKTDGTRTQGVMVVQNSAYAVLLTAKGERSVMRDQIKSLHQLETSLMPGDLLESMSPDEMRDLVSYLQGEKPTEKTKRN